MCHAIAAAYEIDEVKDIRDRAIAIAAYVRQIANHEAENQCAKIRVRAELRAAELYDQETKAKRGPDERGQGSQRATSETTLADHGITKQQMSNWRKLTTIPKKDFEEYVSTQHMPTTAGIINAFFPPPKPKPVSNDALWLWGTLEDFANEGYLGMDPNDCLSTMTEEMLEDVRERLPEVIAWLGRLEIK
jgi:hypothetical protein